VSDPTDTRYFDEEFTRMSPKDSLDSKGSLLTAKENKKYFKNFTFTDQNETLNVSPTIEDNSMNSPYFFNKICDLLNLDCSTFF
jgi:hypothetical protein